MKIKFSHIVASSINHCIGRNNTLPWHFPEDLKFFKKKTLNHILLMGRKTFESLPSPLPNRLHVVLSRSMNQVSHPQVIMACDFEDAVEKIKPLLDRYPHEVFVIGGGEVFKKTLAKVDAIYLTQIHKKYDGDVFYPPVDEQRFELVDSTKTVDQSVELSFLTYRKRS